MIKSAFKLTPLAAGLLVALSATQVAQAGNHWKYGNFIETASAAKFGGVSVANLDADGFPDIILAVESGIEVFFQNPAAGQTGMSYTADEMADGRFSSDNRVVLDVAGGGVRSVVAGDFSGDGIADIAVAGRNSVTLFVGDGARGFDSSKTQVIAVTSPNSDGQPGVVASSDSNEYKDFGNDNNANNDVFHSTTGGYLDYASGAEGLAAMDFDNDGDLDLAVDEGEAGLFVYVNNSGVLSRSGTALVQAADKFGDNLTTSDLNLDGFIDVVARRNIESNQLSTVDVYLGGANGFSSIPMSTAGLNVFGYDDEEDRRKPGSVASCDLNNDGYLDIVSSAPRGYTATGDESATGLNVIYYWDDGASAFTDPVKIVNTSVDSNNGVVIYAAHDMVSCGDIDNDGDADLWLGKSCSTCSDAIFRNDGVNASDQATFTQFINGPLVWSTSPENKDQVAPYSYVTTGSAFADLDLDGDLDLILNSHAEEVGENSRGQQAVIWLNTYTDATNAGEYLMVNPQTDLANTTAPAIGSTVRLWECTGPNSDTLGNAPISVKTINGGTGRGSQDLSLAHFGGVDPNAVYSVEVIFPGDDETNSKFLPVKPSSIPGYQLVTVAEERNYSTKANACDILAADSTTDSDGDGIPDFDPNGVSDPDDDNDGILDIHEGGEGSTRDSDGDGIPDRLDLDSDNDGILDIIEFQANASHETWDTDGDGRYELANAPWDSHQSTERPNGGVPVDNDNDGTPTFLDLDSDNDGLNDLLESGLIAGLGSTYATLDGNGDGRIDGGVATNGLASLVADQTGNLLINYSASYPADADNDGVDDYVSATIDSDGDGLPDNGANGVADPDDDNDGILDIYEGGEGSNRDSDGDGIPDRLDLDSDNDGLFDIVEYRGDGSHTGWDTDGDGRYELGNVSWTSHDSTDRPGAPVDTDSDGAANFIDLDSDDDGVFDLAESGLHTGLGVNYTTLDANNDGQLDAAVNANGVSTAMVSSTGILKVDYSSDYPRDTDRDGQADYVDPEIAIQPNDPANGGNGTCATGWQTGLTAVGIDSFKKDGEPDKCRESEGAVAGSMGYLGGLFMLAMVGVRRRLLAAKGKR